MLSSSYDLLDCRVQTGIVLQHYHSGLKLGHLWTRAGEEDQGEGVERKVRSAEKDQGNG